MSPRGYAITDRDGVEVDAGCGPRRYLHHLDAEEYARALVQRGYHAEVVEVSSLPRLPRRRGRSA